MDDDLMSLRGGKSDPDDDLFGSFADPDDLGFDSILPPASDRPSSRISQELEELDFDDSFDFPDFDAPAEPEPAATPPGSSTAPTIPVPAARPVTKPAAPPAQKRRKSKLRKRSSGGLSPQQRMILSLFLFLDVAILGLFLLLAIGAISF